MRLRELMAALVHHGNNLFTTCLPCEEPGFLLRFRLTMRWLIVRDEHLAVSDATSTHGVSQVMSRLLTRRLVPACAISAAAVAAMVAPGSASAIGGTQCGGVDIAGKGASTQVLSHGLWSSGFKDPLNTIPLACN